MKSKIVSFFINGAGRPWCCKFGSSMTRGSEERVSQGSETAVCGAACPHLSGLSGMTGPPSGSDASEGERLSGKRFRNFLFRRLPVFPRPAAHCDADDDRDGQEYDRARDDQPRIERRAAYRQLRRREERYGECEQHGEESAAADAPHPGVASRHAVAAGQVGLRIAQADACGVHHHVHNQVEPDGEGAQ